ncbi:MAG: AAA family ATPase [Patescibacteria group bacterium]
MARIITLCNQKGGVGKSTTVQNLAAFLAAFGKRVLIVDLDSQANTTSGMGLLPHRLEKTVYDALIGRCSAEDAIKKTPLLAVDILPACSALAGANIELIDIKNREYKLKEVLEPLRRRYDFILIDSAPSVGLLTINALTLSGKVIIPVQCEYYALEGLADLLRTIQLINTNLKARVSVMGALLTMYDRKSRLHRAVAKEIRRKFPGYVFTAVIPRNVSLAEAPSFGKTILQYDPYSHGAKAYRQLAQEILKLEGSYTNVEVGHK